MSFTSFKTIDSANQLLGNSKIKQQNVSIENTQHLIALKSFLNSAETAQYRTSESSYTTKLRKTQHHPFLSNLVVLKSKLK